MTVTRDATATPVAATSGPLTLTWPVNPTAGSKVLVKIAAAFATVTSVVDNGTSPSTFIRDASAAAFGAANDYVYRADSITLPASGSYQVTVTLSGTGNFFASGRSYLGVASGGPTSSNSSSGTSSSITTGNVTPAVTGALCTAVFFDDTAANPESVTLTASGWSAEAVALNGTVAAGGAADIIVSGTSAQTATWTTGDAPDWLALIAVYSPAAAAAAFPLAPLDLRADVSVGGWVNANVGGKPYQREGTSPPVVITRGRPDETSSANASSCTFTVNNRSGNWSPKNPVGIWFGKLGRNTPVRWSVPAIGNYLRLEDQVSSAACGAAAGLDITGDTDIRIDLTPSGCGPFGTMLAVKGSSTHFSWVLTLNPDLTPSLAWSSDGITLAGRVSGQLPVPARGRYALRATLAVSTGTVTFYTAATMGGSFTQLGPSASGTLGASTSVFSGAATLPVAVGLASTYAQSQVFSGTAYGLCGRAWEFQLLSGIGGTVKADPVFSAQTAGATSFSDAQSNTWTLSGTAEISSRDYRYHGELSQLPPRWDSTGNDQWVAVTAGGLLRRLGQGSAPLLSPMARYYTVPGAPVTAAYWNMEDPAGSTQLTALSGPNPLYFSGSPTLASSSAFTGSSPLPVANGASFTGSVTYSGTWTDNDVHWLMQVPQGGEPDGTVVAVIAVTGSTLQQLTVTYNTASSGSLTLKGYDGSGALLFTGTSQTGVNGKLLAVQALIQASNTSAQLNLMTVGTPASSGSSNVFSGTVGWVRRLSLNPAGGLTGTVLGHLAVLPQVTSLLNLNNYQAAQGVSTGPSVAWVYEPAGVRAGRLVLEQGFQFRGTGALTGTPAMGPQSVSDLVSLLQECEAADRGMLTEPRPCLGLGYRTRSSLYNQSPLVLDYSLAQLGGTGTDLQPTYDDQFVRNDETVSRSGGSSSGASARYVLNDGSAMSTGVIGTYANSDSLNLAYDGQLLNEAAWIVHVGTVDEARWPLFPLNLARSQLAALWWQILDQDLGDRFQAANLPNAVTYDPADQLAFQVKESLGGFFYWPEWTAVPASPYTVMAAGSFRAAGAGSVLGANVTTSGIFLSVATTANGASLWTTSAGDLPFDIGVGGERMTVTHITGTGPQTFTVTRSVNGVVKAHSTGDAVQLWQPAVAAL